MTKYYKKLGIYKNSTGSFTYDPSKQEAFSYEWWQLLKNVDGLLVLNAYSYSNSTCKHISELYELLDTKDYVYVEMERNLHNSNKEDILKSFESKVDKLQAKINAPRTRKSTNKRRKQNMFEIQLKRDKLAELWGIPPKYSKLATVLY